MRMMECEADAEAAYGTPPEVAAFLPGSRALGAMRSAIIRPDHVCPESLPMAKE